MSTAQTLGLGAVAGVTIFLGLPIGRMQSVKPATKAFLAATATGILVFLLWDVLSQAVDPVETALRDGRDGRFAWLGFLLAAGFLIGLMSLVYYDLWMKRRRRRAFLGPGAASTAEFEQEHHFTGMSPARWLAVFIATGIGLHNFSEGLAIGQASASNQVSLAIVLIIGFGLHNATEGLGICAPLAGDREQPSWRFLALLGLIGGGPTFRRPTASRRLRSSASSKSCRARSSSSRCGLRTTTARRRAALSSSWRPCSERRAASARSPRNVTPCPASPSPPR